jgi:hypothetical protein
MYDACANETVVKPLRCGRTFRCDHCRRLLSTAVPTQWHRMRFCCAACAAAYQRRLGQEAIEKIRRPYSRMAVADAV